MNFPLIWAEVDLAAIAHNVRALRAITQKAARLLAVVKADGYGHGAVAVARTALHNGADCLAVARLNEALILRQAGIQSPILIFGYTPPEAAPEVIDGDLTITLSDIGAAEKLAASAQKHQATIKAHIKVDTGMGRFGLLTPEHSPTQASTQATAPNRVAEDIQTITRLPGLTIEGLYTHFATADSQDKTAMLNQLQAFSDLNAQLQRQGVNIPLKHAANSAALLDGPATHLDLVRPGIALYGLYPSSEVDHTRIALQPAMTLKTRVIHVKAVPAGFHVSYGHTYTTPAPTTIATVAAGYADGLSRRLSSRGWMLVQSCKAPIIGRVCMDMTLLDVGHIPNVRIGDEVIIWGPSPSDRRNNTPPLIRVEDVADLLDTINYEVVSTVGARVVRQYGGGQAV